MGVWDYKISGSNAEDPDIEAFIFIPCPDLLELLPFPSFE
jgi:hypothetical protein